MARVACPNCEAKAIVTSREKQTNDVSHLYCSCTNSKECGATFRVTQSFDHYLNPPVRNTQDLAAALIKNLPKEQQLNLLSV